MFISCTLNLDPLEVTAGLLLVKAMRISGCIFNGYQVHIHLQPGILFFTYFSVLLFLNHTLSFASEQNTDINRAQTVLQETNVRCEMKCGCSSFIAEGV